jgi:hypothetical protein
METDANGAFAHAESCRHLPRTTTFDGNRHHDIALASSQASQDQLRVEAACDWDRRIGQRCSDFVNA